MLLGPVRTCLYFVFRFTVGFNSLNTCLSYGHKSILKPCIVTDTLAAFSFGLPSKPYGEQQLHSYVGMALFPEHKKCMTK
jgi:hypothetical protein